MATLAPTKSTGAQAASASTGLPRAMAVSIALALTMIVSVGAALALGRGLQSQRLQIALYSARNGDGEIYLMDAPSASLWSGLWGSITFPLFRSEGWDASPARSPDSSLYAFESGRGGGLNLYLIGAHGGQTRRLTSASRRSRSIDPAWSPDGTRIAFASNRSGEWDLYVLNVAQALNNTSANRADGALQLTDDDFQDEAPAWSPDGRQIAYVSWHQENFQIFLIDVPADDAGFVSHDTPPDGPPPRPQPRPLSDRRARYLDPTWSPDGRWLAFASDRLERNFEIYAMDMTGGDILRLTDSPAWDARPSWSADGHTLFFESYRDNNWDIYALDMPPSSDVIPARRLTFDPGRDAEAN